MVSFRLSVDQSRFDWVQMQFERHRFVRVPFGVIWECVHIPFHERDSHRSHSEHCAHGFCAVFYIMFRAHAISLRSVECAFSATRDGIFCTRVWFWWGSMVARFAHITRRFRSSRVLDIVGAVVRARACHVHARGTSIDFVMVPTLGDVPGERFHDCCTLWTRCSRRNTIYSAVLSRVHSPFVACPHLRGAFFPRIRVLTPSLCTGRFVVSCPRAIRFFRCRVCIWRLFWSFVAIRVYSKACCARFGLIWWLVVVCHDFWDKVGRFSSESRVCYSAHCGVLCTRAGVW